MVVRVNGNGLSAAEAGSVIPCFRGVVSIIAQQCQQSAMNPYNQPWSIERGASGTGGTGECNINGDANPRPSSTRA
jgi:hypothetical protein